MNLKLIPQEVTVRRRSDSKDRYEMAIRCDGIEVNIPNCTFENQADGLYVTVRKDDNTPVLMTLVDMD